LIQDVTTYTLVHDVLMDLPGRDAVPDFLVNTNTPRSDMESLLSSGGRLVPNLILESDQPLPIPVSDVPGVLSGSLGGTSASLVLTFANPVSSNVWVHAWVDFPAAKNLTLLSVRRSDGKVLSPKNVWVGKHFNKNSRATTYTLELLDLTSEAAQYTLEFDPTSVDMAPAAVTDLAALSGTAGGQLLLSWTAPGEDGSTGNILGGRVMVQTSDAAEPTFAPEFSQLRFATSTAPGERQSLAAGGLLGNTTLFVRLWTQDTGGSVSEVSNGATAYALPNPPTGFVLVDVGSATAAVTWQIGNNRLPIEYAVRATTGAGVVLQASPYKDSFDRAFTFDALSPNALVTFLGLARSSATGVASPLAVLGSTVTRADMPEEDEPFLYESSATVRWRQGTNPEGTEFYAELSTAANRDPPLAASGWLRASSFTFSGLSLSTSYYARAKARLMAAAAVVDARV
ncbi:MAG: hypothetical protein FD126_1754, partial [Elusimicrobia bacterium]